MNYGEVDLNNPLIRRQFINDLNIYIQVKNKHKLTPRFIKDSLQKQSEESIKNSLLHLGIPIKGTKSILVKLLEKDIRKLIKDYDL